MEFPLLIMLLDMHKENKKTHKYILRTSYKLQTVASAS